MNDNRDYIYNLYSSTSRKEYRTILEWIPAGCRVLDLGCGDGSLLLKLREEGIKGEGIDISKSGIQSAKNKGLKAKIGRIDKKLPFGNKRFDFAICNVTLQMVMYPEILLSEMQRVAQKQIVSFPNFAVLPNRIDLFINGRMPRFMIPNYEWYSTGHIHQLSIKDFQEVCLNRKLNIISKKYIYSEKLFFIPEFLLNRFPNLFASLAIYLLN